MGQYDRVDFRGEPVTRRWRAMVLYTEDDPDIDFQFDIPQGSWQPVTDYSGTTHTGAGIGDLFFPNIGDNDHTHKVVRLLRGRGCGAALLRGPKTAFGNFSVWHVHMPDLDTHGMAASTIWQVQNWRQGREAISSDENGPDPLPWRPDPIRAFNFDAWQDYAKAKGQLHLLSDRIENKRDDIDSLRKERDQAKNLVKRLIDNRL